MGGAGSSRRKNTPIPTYSANTGGSPGIVRPGVGANTSGAPLNRDQQRELMQANQTIANLNNQINAMRGGGMQSMPYGGFPPAGGMPGQGSVPYGTPPMFGQTPTYTPPNPLLQNLGGQASFPYLQQQQPQAGTAVYRDTDFASIANIAGLNPADIAILHREFMNLTRGGATKIDRVIFRQILRDAMIEVSNENVDRAIESLFVNIDRNRDGFIDFPEFIGGFKDVLKATTSDPQSFYNDHASNDALADQIRATGVGSGIISQPLALVQQQQQPATQFLAAGGLNVVPLASMGMQQPSMVYGGAFPMQYTDANPPMITLDPNQSSYFIATPGQYMVTQPTAFQCVPLPLMWCFPLFFSFSFPSQKRRLSSRFDCLLNEKEQDRISRENIFVRTWHTKARSVGSNESRAFISHGERVNRFWW